MKNVLLSLFFLITTTFHANAQADLLKDPKVSRMNILYGASNCHDWHTMLWISLPNRGLTLWGELYNTAYYNPPVGWVIVGQGPLNLPLQLPTGQSCHLLVAPWIFITVPMNNGFGRFKLFDIPKDSNLIGLKLYGQGGFQAHPGKEGFSRGVEFVIQ
tara:strand:+ start:918 stop:1391 length:474 start_codon:yes stop_codon:yes gene_type:complete